MAHKKGAGSSDNGRDSKSKRLGVKLFGGQEAIAGNIIIRQRGTKFHPGLNVGMGKDHTLYAKVDGTVAFQKKRSNRTFVNILPAYEEVAETLVVAAPKKKAEDKVEAPKVAKTEASKSAKADDLRKIEGIGPKIAEHLVEAGITTFEALSKSSVDRIQEVLDAAGPRYSIHQPDTWPMQAGLAAAGKWDELKTLQDNLDGGKVVDKGEEE